MEGYYTSKSHWENLNIATISTIEGKTIAWQASVEVP